MNQTESPSGAAPDAAATLVAVLRAAEQLHERIDAALAKVGLSRAKFETLQNLRAAGRPLSLSALAEGQRCARSNITQLVDRLEADGLVRRVPDPADRRGILAELTDSGRDLADRGAQEVDAVTGQLAASLSGDDRARLTGLLRQIE